MREGKRYKEVADEKCSRDKGGKEEWIVRGRDKGRRV